MSYSDNDDFEKDPFEQDGFESDSSSENGKSEDSGKSDSSPSFDDFLNEFGAFGSDSQQDPDFSAFENGGETPPGQDSPDSAAGEASFDDLLNSSSGTPAEKDDTLAGLADLENFMGGASDSSNGGDTSLDDVDDVLGGPGSDKLGVDFDTDFGTAAQDSSSSESEGEFDADFSQWSQDGTNAETPEPDGDFSLDDLNLSDTPAEKDDTLSGLAGLEDMLGGNRESEPESGTEPSAEPAGKAEYGLNFDFFGPIKSTGSSETEDGSKAETPEPDGDLSLDDLNLSDTPAEKDDTLSGLAGLEDMLGGNQESESGAEPSAELTGEGEGELGLDSDFFGPFSSAESAETQAESETPEPGGDFSLDDLNLSDTPAEKDDTLSGLAGLEEMLGGNRESEPESGTEPSAELTGEGEGELGLDSDFFGSFSSTENAETPAESETPEPDGDFSLDDLNLSDTPAEKDDTLSGLAGLEDMLGGNQESADSGAEPSAELTGEGEGELGLDSDFFGSFSSAESAETQAESETPEPNGDLSFDDLNLSDTPAEKDDTLSGLAGLEDMLGGNRESEPESGTEPSAELTGEGEGELGLDSDFFGSFSSAESAETPAESETPEPGGDFSLDDLNLSDTETEPAAPSAEEGPSLDDLLGGGGSASDTGSLDQFGEFPSEPADAENSDPFSALNTGEDKGADTTMSGLAGLEAALGGGTGTDEDTASRLAGLTADGVGDGALDSDFLGSFADSGTPAEGEEESHTEEISSETASFDPDFVGGFGDDSFQASEEAPTEEESRSFDTDDAGPDTDLLGDSGESEPGSLPNASDESDPFAVLNTGKEPEGESTTAALAGLEGLAVSDGKSEGDVGEDTLAQLGFLSTGSEPEKDQSTTAGLAGLADLVGGGEDSEGEDTAVRLAHITEDDQEDESPDERTLDDLVGSGEGDALFGMSGSSETDTFGDFGGSEDGFGGGLDGFSEMGEPGGIEESEEAEEGQDETDPKKKKRKAKKEKGKKEPKEPKKKRPRRLKKEDTDPVSRLLKIPTILFVLYLILGNIKGLLAAFKPANAFETFCTPFFMIAFNVTGLILFLLPALLRAFRKRYAEDPKLTEYTLFMFMMAAAVAALIFACHPLIFDLARNWGKPM